MDGHTHTTKVSTILCIVLHSTTITGITLHMHIAFMLTVNSVSQIHGHHQFFVNWYILIIKTLQCGKCKSVCLQRVIAWHLVVDLFTLHTTTRQKNIIRTVSAHHRLINVTVTYPRYYQAVLAAPTCECADTWFRRHGTRLHMSEDNQHYNTSHQHCTSEFILTKKILHRQLMSVVW